MTTPRVLIADAISPRGIEELARDNALELTTKTALTEPELVALIPEFSAIIIRSETKVSSKILNAGTKLRVVGRAGVGVDNVDVEAATRRGIVVLNAPGGNTVSTAEHAFSLLLSVARRIPQADASVRGKNWDRKNFEGVELYNKTLGVIGLGRIGSELSRRAIAFGMRVLAYDPYLSATRARSLQVELVDELDDLLTNSDFISLHTPLTAETHHIVDPARLQKTKRGVRIINCARGGLVDEAALARALQDRHVAAAALDVFEHEPLPDDSPLRLAPNLVLTPHLGASTAEAQESVGIEIAQSVRAALLEGTIRNAINMPNLDGYGTLTALRENEATATIPFIFLSGAADKLNMRRGMELGADDYLTKPFTHKELMAAVNTRLEKQAEFQRHPLQRPAQVPGAGAQRHVGASDDHRAPIFREGRSGPADGTGADLRRPAVPGG